MLKKLNIVLVTFFSVLTVSFNVGFSLLIPIIFFFLIREIKNIYYIVPSGGLSLFLLTGTTYLIPFLVLMVVIIGVLWIMDKLNKGFYIYVFVVLLNILTSFIIYMGAIDYLRFGILTIISLMLYMYFEKNLIESLRSETKFYNPSYMEIIMSIVVILGGVNFTVFEVNLGFVMAMYFAMYFSLSFKNIFSMLYSIITMLLLLFYFEIPEAIFIPFISAFYFLPFVYPLLTTNVFVCAVLFTSTPYSDYTMLSLMVASIIFEVMKMVLVKDDLTDNSVKNRIYTKVVDNVSNEMLGFAGFLDKFITAFQTPKEYNERLSEGIKHLIEEHCERCPRKKDCFSTYKSNIYTYFRNLLVQQNMQTNEHKEFFRYCPQATSLQNLANTLSSRYDYGNPQPSNVGLISQISSVSQALRKYTIDLIAKTEIDYDVFLIIKKRTINYGYDCVLFEVMKTFQDDYLVQIGIHKEKFDNIIGILKLICDGVLPSRASIILDHYDGDNCYVNVVPEVSLEVTYGQGSISNEGEHISGDNFLIKDLNTGRFISAISDGMGKGYSAFCESNLTLSLVNELTKSNMESSTALEILNSFYVVQEYLERYATLDFLEINKYTKTAKFFKMGAATSLFIHNNGKIDKITNKSLPFGIDEAVESSEYRLENNDLIIMSSDGVFDNLTDTKEVESMLVNLRQEPPQRIVYELLNYSINHKLKTHDDMTILVLKIRTA